MLILGPRLIGLVQGVHGGQQPRLARHVPALQLALRRSLIALQSEHSLTQENVLARAAVLGLAHRLLAR